MSLETATERKRKRIVEYTISGFPTAIKAITFGNTVRELVYRDIAEVKFRQWFGPVNEIIAVTQDYIGPSRIKLTFLELNQPQAHAIMDKVKKVMSLHTETHGDVLEIDEEILRGKPLPQTINMNKPLHIAIGA